MEITTHHLHVPGARLYYQISGSGPVLLLIAGGTGDADSFGRLLPYLNKHYRMATYDRRGYVRSPLNDPHDTSTVEIGTQSDDASRLLAQVTSEPAYVFGSSLGALIGLDLALSHPEQVRILVAHEPPLQQLRSKEEREKDASLDPRQSEDPEETIEAFAASIGVRGGLDGITIPKEVIERKKANAKFFLTQEAEAVDHYTLDFDGVKKAGTKVVFAGGEKSRDYFPYKNAKDAAEMAGTRLVEFPGHHAGYGEYPEEFAERLSTLFNMQR